MNHSSSAPDFSLPRVPQLNFPATRYIPNGPIPDTDPTETDTQTTHHHHSVAKTDLMGSDVNEVGSITSMRNFRRSGCIRERIKLRESIKRRAVKVYNVRKIQATCPERRAREVIRRTDGQVCTCHVLRGLHERPDVL